MVVSATEYKQNNGAYSEHDGWQEKGQPESHIALGVNHTNLANDRTDIDTQIEVHE